MLLYKGREMDTFQSCKKIFQQNKIQASLTMITNIPGATTIACSPPPHPTPKAASRIQ